MPESEVQLGFIYLLVRVLSNTLYKPNSESRSEYLFFIILLFTEVWQIFK